MTWTRLDDGWTDLPIFESLPYEARWHYLALVQFCSRTDRYDGIIRGSDARRCSDVPDPVAAMLTLTTAGLLVIDERGYRLPFIDQHVPPPYMRDEERKLGQRLRKRRERMHKNGDHALCDPEHCPGNPEPVTRDVTRDSPNPKRVTRDMTRDTGTGRDGTVRALGKEATSQVEPPEKPNADLPHRCRTCSAPIRHRGGMCKSCSDSVIAANSSLRSEPDPDKSTPNPNGDVSDDPDREFRRAI